MPAHRPTFALIALLSVSATSSADDWPYPDDIPVTAPVNVGLAGEKPADVVRYLLAEGASSAKLSPDGQTVAFRWAVSGVPQLWSMDASGGFPRQLTFGSAISLYEWTPDGTHLLVSRDANGNEREGYYLLSHDGTTEREILPQSDAYRAFGSFAPDGRRFVYSSTERNGLDFDIYVADIESGESKLVYEGSFGYLASAWQPGGETVIVTEVRGEDARDVHLLDVETSELTELFTPEIAAQFSDFAWFPDGSGFYVSTNLDREYQGLATYSLADGALRFMDTPDADVGNISLTADGSILVWTTNDDGYSNLHAMDTRSGDRLDVPELARGVYSLSTASNAARAAIRVSGPATPGDVIAWDVGEATAETLMTASLGGLDPESFVAPQSLRYPARDGVELQGLLYLPDAERHANPPVVVQVHGGPSGQSRPSFRAIEQYLVNQGIAVFAVNVRGSTGFGKTYARLDNQEKRLDSVRDLVDTVAFLSDDERLDTRRIAVMGGSYGGYMVNAVLGSYPGVFDAGVSMVGVSDWVRALQEASPGLKASDRIEYGDIREEKWQRFYAENSPINNADKIDVPLLVSHGVNDPRDPVTESDRIVEAVRANGKEVTYLRWPDEGHSVRKRPNRVALYRNIAGFLERQLKSNDDELGD